MVFLPVVLGYVVARGARDVSVGMVFNKKSASGRKTRVRLHSATLEVLISTTRTISVWLIAHREKMINVTLKEQPRVMSYAV